MKPKLTREHAFARWLGDVLPGGPYEHQRRRAGRPGRIVTTQGQLDVVVKCVCAGCNNGWMSVLEEEARPTLTALIAGKPRELDVTEQTTLATWGTKTAMMLDFHQEKPLVRSREHAEFYATRLPPRNAHVWLASYGAEDFLARVENATLRFQPPGSMLVDLIQAFFVTYRIRHLVFQVAVPMIAFEFHRPPEDEQRVRAIWPPTGPITMPMGVALQNEAEFKAFSHPFQSGRVVYQRPAYRAEPPTAV